MDTSWRISSHASSIMPSQGDNCEHEEEACDNKTCNVDYTREMTAMEDDSSGNHVLQQV